VVSVDAFNAGPAELVVVLPLTSKAKGIPFHIEIQPPEGGLKQVSYVKCEDVRSISRERLRDPGSDLENSGAPWTARRSCKSKTG
jgi:mRNA interferase MazF